MEKRSIQIFPKYLIYICGVQIHHNRPSIFGYSDLVCTHEANCCSRKNVRACGLVEKNSVSEAQSLKCDAQVSSAIRSSITRIILHD